MSSAAANAMKRLELFDMLTLTYFCFRDEKDPTFCLLTGVRESNAARRDYEFGGHCMLGKLCRAGEAMRAET